MKNSLKTLYRLPQVVRVTQSETRRERGKQKRAVMDSVRLSPETSCETAEMTSPDDVLAALISSAGVRRSRPDDAYEMNVSLI